MVLEATLICIDNSEWTRNGDFAPSRFEAQQDAANLICGAKANQHQENAIGILTMAGERVEVRVTPTNDLGDVLSGLHGVKIHGSSDFIRSIQTAKLALKHRMNKNQKQRIVCFVGSPISAGEKQLVLIGKQLKKNNVSLDIISFGNVEENRAKLHAIHHAVNSNESSHMVECPAGGGVNLSDAVLNSQVVADLDAPQQNTGPNINNAALNEFGVDPTTDPELYLALRLSLEEEQTRAREAAAKLNEDARPSQQVQTSNSSSPHANMVESTSNPQSNQKTEPHIETIGGMDEELRQALVQSIQENNDAMENSVQISSNSELAAEKINPSENDRDVDMEAKNENHTQPQEEQKDGLADPNFMEQVLGSLPGVDVNDPRIQEALRGTKTDSNEKDEKKEEKE